MGLKIIIGLLILIPTAIAVFSFSVAWMIKFNPGMLTQLGAVLVPTGIVSGIIMTIPLLIGVFVAATSAWEKVKKDKSKEGK